MTAYIILGIVVGLPLLLGMLLRVNTSYLFFSLMAGELLSRYFSDDAELVLRLAVRNQGVQAYAELIVLILPILFTALFLRKSLSKGKLWLHFIPMLLTGVVFAAFALEMLPFELQRQIRSVEVGQQLYQSREIIIGGVVFVQLIGLWLLNRVRGDKHGKHHK
jgi:hypothetical protein